MSRDKETTGTCFVIMGFGKKTDFETGRTLDLDASYLNMIKPAVEAAGLKCIRADEIVHSGMIDVPMYEQLLSADVVVADLSTYNRNALYELGVRHALRPYTTVIIAEDGIKAFPFDLSHVLVRQYHHLGEDIGFAEVKRFRKLLTKAIKEITQKSPREKDSPVYTILGRLNPPELGRAMDVEAENAARSANVPMDTTGEEKLEMESVHTMMQQVDEAQKNSDFARAKNLLAAVREMMKGPRTDSAPASKSRRNGAPGRAGSTPHTDRPEDPYIIQRLALVTYKSKQPTELKALTEARDLLATLNPATSNDTETLGLWGAVHKRLWEKTRKAPHLDEAIRSYERGFYLRNDYYNGINLAYLLNVRSAHAKVPAEAIADFVQAQRIRGEVLKISRILLESTDLSDDSRFWIMATQAEALIGTGKEKQGKQALGKAMSMNVPGWMKESLTGQLDKLKPMLADSPMKHL
jgi:hypothetical protein